MKTTKKQKFVGYKILVDPETGETYPMQMNVKVLTQTEWVFVTNTKKLTRNNKRRTKD